MTDDVSDERLAPAAAFELLSHEVRVGVLEALNEADTAVAFSELRERVGVRDSGQFNYHLGKLVGRFVREVEAGSDLPGTKLPPDEAGYVLKPAGRRVVGAILSGGYTETIDADPVDVGGECSLCNGTYEARFRDEGVTIQCADCGFAHTDPDIPPGVIEGRDRDRVGTIVGSWRRRKQHAGDLGICTVCDGPIDRVVVLPEDDRAPSWFDGTAFPATTVTRCGRCGRREHSAIEVAALTHPAVVGYHWEHDVDLRDTPPWALEWLDIPVATVEREDPLRVSLPIDLDDERREYVFDRDFDLVEERHE